MKRGLPCIFCAVLAVAAVGITLDALRVDDLIIWAAEIGGFLLIIAGEFLIIYLLNLKLSRLYKTDLDGAIAFGNKYLKWCWGPRESGVRLIVAVCYFSKYDDESFLTEIERVTHQKVQYNKAYWLAIYHLIMGDKSTAQADYNAFLNAKEGNNYREFAQVLSGLFSLEEGTAEEVNAKANALLAKVTNPRVKEFIKLKQA